uniref:C-type lectin domain-containing protein n=1 Tax=Panagrolaimus sp. ES5 TaxID=591445 RepID=A0AC34FHA5_9BILA
MNGHLASIHDGFTNAILTSESSKFFHDSTTVDFWIGLNSLMTPGNWSWTDNTPFDFKDWSPSEPQNLSMSCSAVTIHNGYWASSDCFKTKPFVCEISAPVTTTTTTTPSYPTYMNCTEGWLYFEPTHSCYGLDGYGNVIAYWGGAEQYCESFGAHLFSLHSYDEMKFLSTIAGFIGGSPWTGLTSNYNEDLWKWSDGSPFDYRPWAFGYPNRNVSSCAALNYNLNGLYDDDCRGRKNIICKKPAV